MLTLEENVSSIQQYEENLMYSERVKKQQVPKEDDRSAVPVLKLSHLYLITSFQINNNWSSLFARILQFWKISRKITSSEFQNLC